MKKYKLLIILTLIFVLASCSNSNFNGEIQKGNKSYKLDEYIENQGVTAIFIKNARGETYKVVTVGETGYAEYGKDILASAISSLTINTLNSVNELTDTKINYKQKQYKGLPYVEIELEEFMSEIGKEKTIVLIDSLRLGLENIKQSYGENYVNIVVIGE